MKTKELRQNRRLTREMGAYAHSRTGFVPSAIVAIRRRARWAQLGVAPPQVEGPGTTPRVEADKEKSRGGTRATGCVKSFMKEDERWGEVGRAGGFAPRPPGFSAWVPRWVGSGGASGARSRPISAPESALRSHPCGALPSAPATAKFTPPGLRPPGRGRGFYSTGLAGW